MLNLSPATRIFVALSPVDMRAGFNRLYAHVQTRLNQDPLSGHLFVFTNKLRNRIKVLYWDGSGLWVCAKRLERGTFGWPSGEGPLRGLRPEELQLLLHGKRPVNLGSFSLKDVLPALVPKMTYKGMEVAEGNEAGLTWERMIHGQVDPGEEVIAYGVAGLL